MSIFEPDLFVKKITNITEIDLKKLNIENILLDIDDTIVPNNVNKISEDVLGWCAKIRNSCLGVAIISNNSEERTKYFANKFDVPYIYRAKKPLPFRINRLMKLIHANKSNSAIIGDQLFTDILGARICGIKAILVEPMGEANGIKFKLRRRLEYCIKSKFKNSYIFNK